MIWKVVLKITRLESKAFSSESFFISPKVVSTPVLQDPAYPIRASYCALWAFKKIVVVVGWEVVETGFRVRLRLSWRDNTNKQAGAELCQAQVKLEFVVETGVEFGVECIRYSLDMNIFNIHILWISFLRIYLYSYSVKNLIFVLHSS